MTFKELLELSLDAYSFLFECVLSVPDASCDQARRNVFWAVTQNALRHVFLTCGADVFSYACH